MKNDRIIITGVLEKNFNLGSAFEERGLAVSVIDDDGKLLMEAINRLCPRAVLLPAFMPMQDAVGVINMAKTLNGGTEDTIYFVMGNGEGLKTISYIMNNGADYYFHASTKINAVIDKIMYFFEETEDEPVVNYVISRKVAQNGERAVHEVLREVGILPHLKGFAYLNEAVAMGLQNSKGPMPLTKKVYPTIAERYETTELRVERAMRNAIMVAWSNYIKKESPEDNLIFSKCTDRPSNREFLGILTFELKKSLSSTKDYGSQDVG